ncbi:MAG TPA: hypothetical protein V6D20_17320, partial [Candidatus Obscuribacterales bacterium]
MPSATPIPELLPPNVTFSQRIQALPEHSKWTLHRTQIDTAPLLSIALAIQHGTAIAVSDGSFDPATLTGSSAFVLTPSITDITIQIAGQNQVIGSPLQQSAYRSELAGVAGILVLLDLIASHFSLTAGAITIGLDGESALNQTAGDWLLKPQQTDFDLLFDIRRRLKALPIQCSFKWIKGHQDDLPHTNTLDNWALLNVQCDELAKIHSTACSNANLIKPNIRLKHERWSLSLDGNKLSGLNIPALYAQIYKRPTLAWAEKHGITPAVWALLDQQALKRAMKRIPLGKQRWLLKHATGHCAVGRMELLREHQDHSNCPRCGASNKTTTHVLTCTDARAITQWVVQLQRLHHWLNTHFSHPDITKAIITILRHWHDVGTPTTVLHVDPTVTTAIEEQYTIGIYNMLLGRISHQFTDIQTKYLRKCDTKLDGHGWTAGLIRQLWDISFHMWEHRNNIKHSPTHPDKIDSRASMLDQATDQYDIGPSSLLLSDRHLLRNSLQHIYSYSNSHLQQWLNSILLA